MVGMMREILFRGKRCDNGEWMQGYYIRAEHHWHKHGIHKDWITFGASANGGWFALHNKRAVKAGTVGQFTGLTDKNGTKIFEGDIVKWSWDTVFQVVYDDCYLGFIAKEKTGYHICLDNYGLNKIEVIGNIHDNPELLNGGEPNGK
jgi:uncharacterized phage protein (TIGR01671 family)